VSGTVVEVNGAVDERPELVNEAPYGEGWLVLIRPSEGAAPDDLLDASTYEAHVRQAEGA
jgi:glycine cleavage system H protein